MQHLLQGACSPWSACGCIIAKQHSAAKEKAKPKPNTLRPGDCVYVCVCAQLANTLTHTQNPVARSRSWHRVRAGDGERWSGWCGCNCCNLFPDFGNGARHTHAHTHIHTRARLLSLLLLLPPLSPSKWYYLIIFIRLCDKKICCLSFGSMQAIS